MWLKARSNSRVIALPLLLVSVLACAGARPSPAQSPTGPAGGKPASEEAFLTVDRGEGFEPLLIPRAEQLDFVVAIDTFLGDIEVGTVTLSTGTESYNPGLPVAASDSKSHEVPSSAERAPDRPPDRPKGRQLVGTIQSVAHGSYLGYTLHHELDVRHLPQQWPSSIYRDRQSGSENRQREIKLGVLDGKPTSVFKSDGHCKGCSNPEHFVESAWVWGEPYHCKKCKRAEHRVWDPPVSRSVPPGTVDLLSAVYLARELVRQGGTTITFSVLDKKRLWDLTVRRGETKEVEVPAGKFRCAQVSLKTAVPPGEPADKDGFAGLFGIRGGIKIFMDADTGVPVLITGELPVPVIGKLDLYVRLQSYRGTSGGFGPVR